MPTLFRRRSDALAADNQTADEVVRFWRDAGAEQWFRQDPRFDQRFRARFWACIWRRPGVNATTGLRRRKARWR